MRLFGLIGYPLAQSFSKKFFTEKFEKEGILDCAYDLYPISTINEFATVSSTPNLKGLNVTIPYKQDVIAFLNEIDAEAKAIGACNCIKIDGKNLKGFNTDAPAFRNSLLPLLQPHHKKALVLGTGGAAKAVMYVLEKLGIESKYVSRTKEEDGRFTYDVLTQALLQEYTVIVNCTPLGSFPKVESYPPIPYQYITHKHLLYDLVYNPPQTVFLKEGWQRGATIKNGYDMLVGQAELSWEIWNSR